MALISDMRAIFVQSWICEALSSRLPEPLNIPVIPDEPLVDTFSFRSEDEVIRDDAEDEVFGAAPNLRLYPSLVEETMRSELLEVHAKITVSALAPYFTKRIEEAVERALGPAVSALRSHGEEQQMRNAEFLGVEEKKLALRRNKIQPKRRRAGRFQRRRKVQATFRLTSRQGARRVKSRLQ